MIIIPAERTIDWRHPPWVTLSLIIMMTLIYVFYQSGDNRLLGHAISDYRKSGLLKFEVIPYINYLDRHAIESGKPNSRKARQIRVWLKKQQFDRVAKNILLNQEFYPALLKEGKLIWTDQQYLTWKKSRLLIMVWLNKLSDIRFGLIPARFNLSALLSYQFLHGSLGHLIGNMVFLFLLGFTIERALGGSRFLLVYVACGMFSGAFYALMETHSLEPMIGASGAISGLMGMYVVLFGLKKIRFFYFLGFFFNYFTAPALLLLPFWIGVELFYFFTVNNHVAYMAHAGGLIAGAGLMAGLRKNVLKVQDDFYDPSEEEKDLLFRKMYANALDAVSNMEFDVARQRFEILWKDYPDRLGMLEHLYYIEKLDPESDSFHQRAIQLLKESLKRHYFDMLISIYRDYLKRSGELCQIDGLLYNQILYACLRQQEMVLAEGIFQKMRQCASNEMIQEAGQVLIREFSKRQDLRKVEQYRKSLALVSQKSEKNT